MDTGSDSKPWLSDERWTDGVARSTAGKETRFLVVMAVLWNAFTIPMTWFVAVPELREGNDAAAVIGLFVLAGVFLAWSATVKVIQWRRFGSLTLVLDPFPGEIGGEVGGTIDVPVQNLVREQVTVTLNCIRVSISGSENKTRHETVVWRNQGTVEPEQTRAGWRLRFRFAVPDDLPESEPPSNNHHEWIVHVQCSMPGADLDRSFAVPVFKHASARPSSVTRTMTQDEASAREVPPGIAQVVRSPRGLSIFYPVTRNLGLGVMLSIFGLVFGCVPGWILYKLFEVGQPDNGFGGFFTGISVSVGLVFGMVALFLLLCGIYLLGNSLRVTFDRNGVSTLRRIYGFPLRRFAAREDLIDLESKILSQQGQGAKASVRYTLRAKTRDGGTVTLGDGVRGVTIARYLTGLMRETLGMPAEASV